MTKTCSQCGAVLASSVRVCNFCDSSVPSEFSGHEDFSAFPHQDSAAAAESGAEASLSKTGIAAPDDAAAAWRSELSVRMEAYRRKRRRNSGANPSQIPFEYESVAPSVAVEEPHASSSADFSFTVAIGRNRHSAERSDRRMEIDVTVPATQPTVPAVAPAQTAAQGYGQYPVASLEERRFAAGIDMVCLLFAYGGFLALFSSLGGQFTLSKLSAAVYALSFAIVYLQYFALFTVFGGTTPGMMFRGLQVTSFSGDTPSPRQLLLRSAGYIISAGTFFLGFFWAWWDEDALTWHDRLSHTYLGVQETHEDLKSSAMAPQP